LNKYRVIENRLRRKYDSISIKDLRFQNKLLIIYSLVVTFGLFFITFKYMLKSNNDEMKFINYDAQIATLESDKEYYKNNAQMFSESVSDLLEVTAELNTDRDLLIADNQLMSFELEEFYEREELYDSYGFFLYDKQGERNDITYDHLRTLEELVEDSSIPNPELVLSIIYLESGGGHCDAVNGQGSGASGFGQFLPSTARSVWIKVLGNPEDSWEPEMVFDPDINLQLTVAYMDYLIEKHGGPYEALRQYSGSGENTAHLNGYVATLDSYLRHTDVGSFAACEAQYQANK
jgi:hypothetical protein